MNQGNDITAPDEQPTVNEWLSELGALLPTLPYCDLVVNDKAAASTALRTGLAGRLQAIVLSRLSDLIPLLS